VGDKPLAHEFVRFLVGSFVDHPDDIELFVSSDGKHELIEVGVAKDDLPNVIGRGGKTAQALRAVLDAWTWKHRLRAHLRILEEEEEPKGDSVDGDDDEDDDYEDDVEEDGDDAAPAEAAPA
jgi:uncharacterized protein